MFVTPVAVNVADRSRTSATLSRPSTRCDARTVRAAPERCNLNWVTGIIPAHWNFCIRDTQQDV